MSLINCPDCDRQVSSMAPACPQCGAPITRAQETRAAGTPLTTIQETSKKLKAQMLLSVILTLVGMLAFCSASPDNPGGDSAYMLGILAFLVGLIWFFVTRLRIWWHHHGNWTAGIRRRVHMNYKLLTSFRY